MQCIAIMCSAIQVSLLYRAVQNSTVKESALWFYVVQSSALQCRSAEYNIEHSAEQDRTEVQYSAVQFKAEQYSSLYIVQDSTVQCSSVQYRAGSTVQNITL